MKEHDNESQPKICGADIELGNFVTGDSTSFHYTGTGHMASSILLSEIDGVNGYSYGVGKFRTSQDWGRKFLNTNGGCVYIDMAHLELCLPEVRSAIDHVTYWHAMIRIARKAMQDANIRHQGRKKVSVLINNSDGLGHAYGSHLNFLVSRRTWDNIFKHKLHYLLFLASYQVSSIIFTGQGKVGSENDQAPTLFQISQRADFFECLAAERTTYSRPIVNTRNETLTTDSDAARLHVIFYDNTLCHVSSFLKVGVMQIILTMIEKEFIFPNIILDNPVEALIGFSHDPNLYTKAEMITGKKYSAIDIQMLFLEHAKRFVEEGKCDGIVPDAHLIIGIWEDTLLKLRDRDFNTLSHRIDWVLKMRIIEEIIKKEDLYWSAPVIKHLDQLYSNLDSEQGLYWIYERAGIVDRLVSEAAIEYAINEPPDDTRAWTRTMLLRFFGRENIKSVDWDKVSIRKQKRKGFFAKVEPSWSKGQEIDLGNPASMTKERTGHLFNGKTNGATIIDALK